MWLFVEQMDWNMVFKGTLHIYEFDLVVFEVILRSFGAVVSKEPLTWLWSKTDWNLWLDYQYSIYVVPLSSSVRYIGCLCFIPCLTMPNQDYFDLQMYITMGLIALLVVLNHLPYNTQLNFMLNGHVADVTCLVVFKRFKFIYIHMFHSTINCVYLRFNFSIYYHAKFQCHSLT